MIQEIKVDIKAIFNRDPGKCNTLLGGNRRWNQKRRVNVIQLLGMMS